MLGNMSVTKLSIAVTTIPLTYFYDFSFDLSKIRPYKEPQSQTIIKKNDLGALFTENKSKKIQINSGRS